jgi:hypothetical protein
MVTADSPVLDRRGFTFTQQKLAKQQQQKNEHDEAMINRN